MDAMGARSVLSPLFFWPWRLGYGYVPHGYVRLVVVVPQFADPQFSGWDGTAHGGVHAGSCGRSHPYGSVRASVHGGVSVRTTAWPSGLFCHCLSSVPSYSLWARRECGW